MKHDSLIELSQLVLVMFLRATCMPFLALGIASSPHLTFLVLRAGLAGIILIAASLCLKRKQPSGFKQWSYIVLIGLFSTALGLLGMMGTLEHINPGVSVAIFTLQPIITAFLAWLLLKEHLSNFGKMGLIFGFIGALLIAGPEMLSLPEGDASGSVIFIIITVIGVTTGNLFLRSVAGSVDAVSAMGWQLLIGSMFLAIPAVLYENSLAITWSVAFVMTLFIQALFTTAFASWLWFRCLEKIELSAASAYAYLVPVFALFLAHFLNGEKLSGYAFAGVFLILAGLACIRLKHSFHHIRIFANQAFVRKVKSRYGQ